MRKSHNSEISIILICLIAAALSALIYGVVDKMTSNQTATLTTLTEQSARITALNLKDGEIIADLKKQNNVLILKQRDEYFNRLTVAIVAYYHATGTVKDKAFIKDCVVKAFSVSETLHARGLIKVYSECPRDSAIQILGVARPETNFDVWVVYNEKNGTKSYGICQINEINLDPGYQNLKRLGLWTPESNRWAFDVEINFILRMLIDEDRTRRGWDIKGVGRWDAHFVALLQKIPVPEGLKWTI